MRTGMIYTDQTKKALKICYKAHKGQKDAADIPYVFHPLHLAEQMSSEYEVCAALLHDVVEDTHYTMEDLTDAGFPKEVLDAVEKLTHDRTVPYMEYILDIRGNELAKKVKLADLAHNTDYTRLDRIQPSDRTRNRKYRIARALLTPPQECASDDRVVRYIPLSDDKKYGLSLFYDRNNNDGHSDEACFGILKNDNKDILRLELDEERLFTGSGKVSLIEEIAEFLAYNKEEDLPSFLDGQGIPNTSL